MARAQTNTRFPRHSVVENPFPQICFTAEIVSNNIFCTSAGWGVPWEFVSAIWELTPEGDITKQWYGRSIITSCCKLDYEAAQAIIETEESSEGEEEWKLGEIALHGGFTWDQVAKDVRLLHKLGQVCALLLLLCLGLLAGANNSCMCAPPLYPVESVGDRTQLY